MASRADLLDEAKMRRNSESTPDLLAEPSMLARDVEPRAAPALDEIEHRGRAVVPADLGGKPGQCGCDGGGMTIAEITQGEERRR